MSESCVITLKACLMEPHVSLCSLPTCTVQSTRLLGDEEFPLQPVPFSPFPFSSLHSLSCLRLYHITFLFTVPILSRIHVSHPNDLYRSVESDLISSQWVFLTHSAPAFLLLSDSWLKKKKEQSKNLIP